MKQEKVIGWLCLVIIVLVFGALFYVMFDKAMEFQRLNIQLESKVEANVNWLYNCPSYMRAFYDCPNNLKFQNMTGYYCNKTIICENKYEIINSS